MFLGLLLPPSLHCFRCRCGGGGCSSSGGSSGGGSLCSNERFISKTTTMNNEYKGAKASIATTLSSLCELFRIMKPMHKVLAIPYLKLPHEAFPEFYMSGRSFSRRPVDDTYFTTILDIVLVLHQVGIAIFVSSAEIATLHPPRSSHCDGGAIKIVSVVQVGNFIIP